MIDKKKQASAADEWNRGGQVLMHFIRMLHQTILRYTKIVIVGYALITIGVAHYLTDSTDLYMGSKYLVSSAKVSLTLDKGMTNLTLPGGREVRVKDVDIVNNSLMKSHADSVIENFKIAAYISTLISLLLAWLLYKFIRKKGQEEAKDEHIRGIEFADKNVLISRSREMLKEDGRPSTLSMAGIPLQPGQELSGIALIGSPGVGKSTAIRDILRQFRANRNKAVIYDIDGEFVMRFYRPGIDVILNVFDKRSHSWDFWAEGKNAIAYDRHAKAAIPEPRNGGDPFWIYSPRLLLSSFFEVLGRRFVVPGIDHLMNIILRMSDENIAAVVANSDARNVMNLKLDKLAGSVRAVITAYTRNFKYLSGTTGPRFSFKKWANDEQSDQWVFITVRDDMKETLRPIMTMMLDSAASALLSLESSNERRIAFSVDEIATLQEIPSLADIENTGRKKGIVPIIGFQTYAQMVDTYGEQGAKIIMDSIGTVAAFRINGGDGAKWVSGDLGDQEKEQSLENTSYGANDVRDSTTINRNNKEQNAVMQSQIQELPDNTCILKLNRGLPLAKIKYPLDKMPLIAKGLEVVDILNDKGFVDTLSANNSLKPEDVVAAIERDMGHEQPPEKHERMGGQIPTSEEALAALVNELTGQPTETKRDTESAAQQAANTTGDNDVVVDSDSADRLNDGFSPTNGTDREDKADNNKAKSSGLNHEQQIGDDWFRF